MLEAVIARRRDDIAACVDRMPTLRQDLETVLAIAGDGRCHRNLEHPQAGVFRAEAGAAIVSVAAGQAARYTEISTASGTEVYSIVDSRCSQS